MDMLDARPRRPYQAPSRPMRGALQQVTRDGDLSGLAALVKKYPQAVNQLGPFLTSPLHEACRLGHRPIVEFLLSQGAGVHARDQWNRTPLWIASWWGRADLVELLLDADAGSDATILDTKGRSASDIAAMANRCPDGAKEAIVRLLTTDLRVSQGAATDDGTTSRFKEDESEVETPAEASQDGEGGLERRA